MSNRINIATLHDDVKDMLLTAGVGDISGAQIRRLISTERLNRTIEDGMLALLSKGDPSQFVELHGTAVTGGTLSLYDVTSTTQAAKFPDDTLRGRPDLGFVSLEMTYGAGTRKVFFPDAINYDALILRTQSPYFPNPFVFSINTHAQELYVPMGVTKLKMIYLQRPYPVFPGDTEIPIDQSLYPELRAVILADLIGSMQPGNKKDNGGGK